MNLKYNYVTDARNLIRRFMEDDVMAMGSELAYSFLLAFFPFLIFILTLAGYSPITSDQALEAIRVFLPREAYSLIRNTVIEVFDGKNGKLLSFSLIVTIWTAASGFKAVIKGLNKAYDEKEKRSFIRVQLVALLATIALSAIAILTLALLVLGETFWKAGIKWLGLGDGYKHAWDMLRYAVILISMVLVFAALYHFTPSKRLTWKEVFPGAIFSTIGWIVSSVIFAFYVNNFGNYSKIYGSIGAVIMLLTWLFISSVIIVLGGEVNATLAFDRKKQHSEAGMIKTRN